MAKTNETIKGRVVEIDTAVHAIDSTAGSANPQNAIVDSVGSPVKAVHYSQISPRGTGAPADTHR